ncbi:MAG: ABC transporter permease subunit [Actinobacteria bacterium]|nr:ABC transporter permease subunit [Actinomycetota bacterium]
MRTATRRLSRQRVIGRHAVRNSLIPVVTFIGADFGALLGGAIVTEESSTSAGSAVCCTCPSAPGGATVVGVVTVLVLVFLLVNLLVDILYGAIDPRIRYAVT